MPGLWKRQEVLPVVDHFGVGSEVAFAVKDDAAVDALHATRRECRLPILQHPVRLDLGYTFVAEAPDELRLRVFAAYVYPALDR